MGNSRSFDIYQTILDDEFVLTVAKHRGKTRSRLAIWSDRKGWAMRVDSGLPRINCPRCPNGRQYDPLGIIFIAASGL